MPHQYILVRCFWTTIGDIPIFSKFSELFLSYINAAIFQSLTYFYRNPREGGISGYISLLGE